MYRSEILTLTMASERKLVTFLKPKFLERSLEEYN